jgi:hypothetical protein
MAKQVTFWWDDDIDDVCFVLDQQTKLGLYSASKRTQQSKGRYVTLLGHIIVTPNQPVFDISCMRAKRQSRINLVFDVTWTVTYRIRCAGTR